MVASAVSIVATSRWPYRMKPLGHAEATPLALILRLPCSAEVLHTAVTLTAQTCTWKPGPALRGPCSERGSAASGMTESLS